MKYVTLHTKWTLQITDPEMERLPWIIQVMQSQGPLLVKALLSQTPMIQLFFPPKKLKIFPCCWSIADIPKAKNTQIRKQRSNQGNK